MTDTTMGEMETCSWCCAEVKYSQLKEAGGEGAMVCPLCLKEWRELKQQAFELSDRLMDDPYYPIGVPTWSRHVV